MNMNIGVISKIDDIEMLLHVVLFKETIMGDETQVCHTSGE